MVDEHDNLISDGTWILVLPSPSQHVIGSIRMFISKRKIDGFLVAQGFDQQEGSQH